MALSSAASCARSERGEPRALARACSPSTRRRSAPRMAKTTLRQRRDLGVGASQAQRRRGAVSRRRAGLRRARRARRLSRADARSIFGLDDRIVPARHARGLPGTDRRASLRQHRPYAAFRGARRSRRSDPGQYRGGRAAAGNRAGGDAECGAESPAAQFFRGLAERAQRGDPRNSARILWFPSRRPADRVGFRISPISRDRL